ncbi:MAG: LURP-one-related family protein [Ktedonobacterales bacterium]|nr:LURP-one-related family protein [Ktedonobacterales bacterium]
MRYIIRERLFHLTEDSVITDEAGQAVLQVAGKFFSLHDRLTISDMAGNEVVQIARRLVALTPTYEILRGGQEVAEMRKRFFTPFGDRYAIDIPGPNDLEMRGNFLDHEFVITQGGTTVATISKQWLSLSATYGVETAPGQDDVLILACVLAMDLAEDRESR